MAESLLAETIAQVLAPSLSLFAPLSSLNRCCHSGSCRGEAVGGRSGRSVGLARAWAKHVHSVLAAKYQPNADDEQGKRDIPEKVEGLYQAAPAHNICRPDAAEDGAESIPGMGHVVACVAPRSGNPPCTESKSVWESATDDFFLVHEIMASRSGEAVGA